MELQVTGRNLPVTDALHEHAERKLAKLERFLPAWDGATRVELELFVERNKSVPHRQVAEATVRTKGPILRAQEHADDMYTAIDHVVSKLERQATKYRERRKAHRDPHHHDGTPPPEPVTLVAGENEEATIVKRKSFEMKPMSLDDAALQLDMLNHDFYVFRDADAGRVSVIYRRADGNLGLIAPDA
jgi:putative sigma-54 modulation protein